MGWVGGAGGGAVGLEEVKLWMPGLDVAVCQNTKGLTRRADPDRGLRNFQSHDPAHAVNEVPETRRT